MNYGFQEKANPGRELFSTVDGVKYARYPIATPYLYLNDNLDDVIEKYAKPHLKEGDVLGVATKIVSICCGFYVKEEDIKVGRLAKFLVKFVKKWPNDAGFAVPAKVQLAMNIAGMPRFLFAMVVGGLMKYLGKPGYFYKIVGHNISAIDGFIPEQYPEPLQHLGFLAPEDPDKFCEELEKKHNMPIILLDGNNVDNNILGMGTKAKEMYSKEKLMEILSGNPQSQGDEGVITPMLLVRKV
jgi:hypothetical protein